MRSPAATSRSSPPAERSPAALGDFIASALNIYAGSWMEAAGPSRLELIVLDLFKQWIGYPEQAAGVLVSGGSAANMTALACAREAAARNAQSAAEADGGGQNVAYVSDQAHSSIARAARALGMRPGQLRVLPTDERHRMRLDALAGAIAADVRRGRTPFSCPPRRVDQHRRDRPAAGDGRDLPRGRRVAARRRRLRRIRGADRARPRLAGGHRAGRLGHARSAQVAVPAVRVRMRARARRRAAAQRVRGRPRLSQGCRGACRRGQLLRPGVPADALVESLEAVAVAQLLRGRRVPRPRSTARSTSPCGPSS